MIKFIDLFAGLGGFRIAFEKAKCKCVFSAEIDSKVLETYKANFNVDAKCDITKLDPKILPDFDILCAGFPCQPFSLAGKRLGFEDARGTLFFDVVNILKIKKPYAFFLENVKGLVNHDKGKTLKTILGLITLAGYDYKYKVINAKDCGIPQNRERWYCVGFRNDLNINLEKFNFPTNSELKFSLQDILENNVSKEYNVSTSCKKNITKFVKEKNIKIKNDTLAYEIRASRCQFKNDGICNCLTAKMGTGGCNVPVLVNKMRKLTERECIRLMGYPDSYYIGKGMSAYKQIGNSVIVPIVTDIANELVKILSKALRQ